MPVTRIAPCSALLACCTLLLSPVLAQSGNAPGKVFDKVYPVSRAELQVVVDNSSVHARSCGTCREVRVHVDMHDANPSHYRLQESQSGNLVRFSLKERDGEMSWHLGTHRGPEVTVLLPTESNVKLQADNGELALAGVNGSIDMRADNGALSLAESRGVLHLSTDNGRIVLDRVEGELTASTDNGSITGDGRFAQIQARTDNGHIRLAALDGSPLGGGVHVTTGNGTAELVLPRSLRADVDLRSDLGSIECNLPLSSRNGSEDKHHVHGSMNGGGSIVRIVTGNGSIHLSAR